MRFSAVILAATALFAGFASAMHQTNNLELETRLDGLVVRYDPGSTEATTLSSRTLGHLSDNELVARAKVYARELRSRDEADICMICLEKIRAPKYLMTTCPVGQDKGHEVCTTCIQKLYQTDAEKPEPRCPVCRRVLVEDIKWRKCKAATPPPSP